MNPTYVDDSESTDDDVEEFIIDDNGSDSENGSDGEPPPLPPRWNAPPLPPRRQFGMEGYENDTVETNADDQITVERLEEEQELNNLSEDPRKGCVWFFIVYLIMPPYKAQNRGRTYQQHFHPYIIS
jgi:hypothetical protein